MNDKIIAYQGVEGAYSNLACKNSFPNSITIACETFEDAMKL
ncbi:MAG TPA: prephenate dehydratase, partial [Sulfurospirillum sp. UBA11407]